MIVNIENLNYDKSVKKVNPKTMCNPTLETQITYIREPPIVQW